VLQAIRHFLFMANILKTCISQLNTVLSYRKTYLLGRKVETGKPENTGGRVLGRGYLLIGSMPCKGVFESFISQLFKTYGGHQMSVCLVAVEGGYVIRASFGKRDEGVFVMAEHSKQMRVFKKADSALAVCKRIGLPVVSIEL
jgi:hypothetical protein